MQQTPGRFRRPDQLLLDPAMLIEHILCSVCQCQLPSLALGLDKSCSQEPAIQAQPPKSFRPCSPSRLRTCQRFFWPTCSGYFLYHAIMVASRRPLGLCRWLARSYPEFLNRHLAPRRPRGLGLRFHGPLHCVMDRARPYAIFASGRR